MELFFFRLTLVFPLVFVRVKSLTFFVFLSSALSLLCKKKKKKKEKSQSAYFVPEEKGAKRELYVMSRARGT